MKKLLISGIDFSDDIYEQRFEIKQAIGTSLWLKTVNKDLSGDGDDFETIIALRASEMKALGRALVFAADCIVPDEFCFKRKVLKELLEQLKKLREEYAQANAAQKAQLSNKILQLEQEILNNNESPMTYENRARRAELNYLGIDIK
jgi:hypothetical protein